MSVYDEIVRGHDEIHRLCRPGEMWRMSIPANPRRDSDLILSDALDAGEQAQKRVDAIREFAEEIIAYEKEHSAGADTPLRLAFASDILAILDGQ